MNFPFTVNIHYTTIWRECNFPLLPTRLSSRAGEVAPLVLSLEGERKVPTKSPSPLHRPCGCFVPLWLNGFTQNNSS